MISSVACAVFPILVPAATGVPPPKKDSPPPPKDAIAEKVKKIIVEQLEVDESKVVPDARFMEDLGADSTDVVELINTLEEAFDVKVSDVDAEKILTVANAIDYIKAHIHDAKKSK
jgi:acyl carrier protein